VDCTRKIFALLHSASCGNSWRDHCCRRRPKRRVPHLSQGHLPKGHVGRVDAPFPCRVLTCLMGFSENSLPPSPIVYYSLSSFVLMYKHSFFWGSPHFYTYQYNVYEFVRSEQPVVNGALKQVFVGYSMGVSWNRGTHKSSIYIGFFMKQIEINHPFWGTPIYGNLHITKLSCQPRILLYNFGATTSNWQIPFPLILPPHIYGMQQALNQGFIYSIFASHGRIFHRGPPSHCFPASCFFIPGDRPSMEE
jgi:hypothetical protein